MLLRAVVSSCLLGACLTAPAIGQSRVVDEGTFVVLKGGTPTRTESFKITRNEASFTATAGLTIGTQQTTSMLTTDSLGTPLLYELHVKDRGAKVVDVRAVARAGRLTSMATFQSGDESMREYPLAQGKSLIVDSGLLHHMYFAALGKTAGTFQVIEPRSSRSTSGSMTARGLEPIEVAGRTVTATHYTLSSGSARYEFWIDAQGRLLRVDVPADGLSATREELPR
jgi:hypothetical protein